MKLTAEEIKYLENLAKIELDEEKKEKFANEIGEILGYVAEVQSFDVSNSQVVVSESVPTSVYRNDSTIGRSEDHKKMALENAPNKEADYFKVSKVIKN